MLLTGREAAKDTILAAEALFMVFSFLPVKKCLFL
jgi:hypothetical protein